MNIDYILDEVYCNPPDPNDRGDYNNQKRQFIQAKASENLNLTIYDNCIVFNKLAFDIMNNYKKAKIVQYDKEFQIELNNTVGCNINKNGNQPRLNIKNVISKFNLQKGKYRYNVINESTLTIEFSDTVEKYDNEYNTKQNY